MRKHIASHAAIRGITACMIIIYHVREGALHLQPRLTHPQSMERWYLLVDIFFILSGFIITYTTSPNGKPLDWEQSKRFWFSRITRIYPLHLFCTAMFLLMASANALNALRKGAPLDPLWSMEGVGWVVQEALLIQSVGIPGFRWLNPVTWSISAEMFAYVLFPLLLLATARRSGILLLLSFSLAFYGWVFATGEKLDMCYGLAPLRCLAAFIIGQAICLYRDFWERLSPGACDALQMASVVGITAVTMLPVSDVYGIPCAALLVAASWPDRGRIAAFLSTRPLQYLGEISYSLYLMHWLTLIAVTNVWIHLVSKLHLPYVVEQAGWIIAVPALSFPIAALTHHYIELPARHHFKRRRDATRVKVQPGLITT
ncbi:acyltransferase [Sphingobium sp. H39-3-25]|uniref:acyltransferase family protein n=1 Tax=Sphingobium arseniciresistens TaxID=3030834 RepID=UPI0023B88ECB|nr:acyltransferase [Sphingobium arseniciresistens]